MPGNPMCAGRRELKPRNECLYYLVREMGGLGVKAKDVYFEDALEHVRQRGFEGMAQIEVGAMVRAAMARGRVEELDRIVEEGGVCGAQTLPSETV